MTHHVIASPCWERLSRHGENFLCQESINLGRKRLRSDRDRDRDRRTRSTHSCPRPCPLPCLCPCPWYCSCRSLGSRLAALAPWERGLSPTGRGSSSRFRLHDLHPARHAFPQSLGVGSRAHDGPVVHGDGQFWLNRVACLDRFLRSHNVGSANWQ